MMRDHDLSATHRACANSREFVAGAVADHLTDLHKHEARHRALYGAFQQFGAPDLLWSDWLSLFATTSACRPDLVLEFGRGYGTSTAAFRFAGARVISICRSNIWPHTVEALREIEPIDWTNDVEAIVGEIAGRDYSALVGEAKRVLIFWDAHGYDVAEVILSQVLPACAGREVMVICHDMRDSRYFRGDAASYGDARIWRGQENPAAPWLRIGNVHSTFDQLVSIVDFTSRNAIELCSPTHEVISNEMLRGAFPDAIWPYCLWHYFLLPIRGVFFPSAIRAAGQRL